MNKNYTYLSKLGPYIKDFISLKIANGYIYREGQYQLSRFDKFCFENPNLDVGTITKEQLSIWGRKFPNENKNSRNDRVSYIIKFAKYLNCIGIEAFIPPNGASRTKPIVIIPSINDLHIFFKYIDNHIYISKEKSLVHMNLCYPILFRLLYCCGMRLAEVCYLERRYVNFDDNSISILQSKGIKDRKIYFSDDLSIYINKFDAAMQKIIPNRQWMFIGKNINNPFPKTSIDRIFHQFWYEAFPHWEGKYPTPHSLRHCFVVNKITQWLEDDVNINFMMPYLSKYLGHSTPNETYYYYKNKESIFASIENKDKHSKEIIPKVTYYEK